MACIVMAYIALAYKVMACIVMAYIVMAYIVMACIVMDYIVMAYIVMARASAMCLPVAWLWRYMETSFMHMFTDTSTQCSGNVGTCAIISYGLYSYGLCSHGLHSSGM